MGDEARRAANGRWWSVQVEGRLYDYRAGVPSIARDRERFSSLEACAQWRVWDAFYLLVDGYEEIAHGLADYAVLVAEEALRTESFERQFRVMKAVAYSDEQVEDESFRPSHLQRSIEVASGRRNCLLAIHYARWFGTGVREMGSLRDALEWERERYELLVKQYMKAARVDAQSLAGLLQAYVEAGDFRAAADLCRRDYEKPVWEMPRTRGAGRDQVHVLYLLAELGLGEHDALDVVRACTRQWYDRSRNWPTDRSIVTLMERSRLGWAYLWQKHFGGVIEMRPLLDDLRGY